MLNIRLAVGGSGREVEAVDAGQKRGEVFVDLGAPAAVRLDTGLGVA
jgi:hypothetical protein